MEPEYPPGWKVDQREFAEWSDDSSNSSLTTSSSIFTDEEEDEVKPAMPFVKVLKVKKVYKIILEEEDLIA